MHPVQCHGPSRPVSMFADSSGLAAASYTSPSTSSPASSVGLSTDVRLETAGSPVTTYSHSPASSSDEQSPSLAFQQLHQHQSSPESRKYLKRRASQGAFPASKPSSVSRFLSRNPAAANCATSTIRGVASGGRGGGGTSVSRDPAAVRAQSFDSSLRLSTASDSSRSDPTASWQNDYPAALPPTPPEDNDDTVPVAWNAHHDDMLLVEPQLNAGQQPGSGPGPGPGPLVGHHPSPLGGGRSGGHSHGHGHPHSHPHHHHHHHPPPKSTPTVDGISSPSDQLSSAAASPSSNEMDCDEGTWLENGIDAAIASLPSTNGGGETVKLVSQTLPYPRAADKSVVLPTHDSVFAAMVQAVQNRLRQGRSPYINITHAVPEQFSLSNLPTSPPSTPITPGEEYFNSTVFSNAAVVSTYHDFRGPTLQMQQQQQPQGLYMPMPVVPPQTVQLSVLERYLPPSSGQEYRDMFSSHRPSYLVDRMFELSPDGGSLLFIYPTKRGGATFKSQYLGPILDPLLRQLVVVNELSADVSRYLGKLTSVSQMDDFEAMKDNIAQLCDTLSASSATQFAITDARKGSAHLDRNLWTEWFIHQEKARMKEVLSLYWQNGRRLPINKTSTTSTMPSNFLLADKEVTSAMLLGDILDGIRRRPYGEENEHQDGVELGVFVIRRTK